MERYFTGWGQVGAIHLTVDRKESEISEIPGFTGNDGVSFDTAAVTADPKFINMTGDFHLNSVVQRSTRGHRVSELAMCYRHSSTLTTISLPDQPVLDSTSGPSKSRNYLG